MKCPVYTDPGSKLFCWFVNKNSSVTHLLVEDFGQLLPISHSLGPKLCPPWRQCDWKLSVADNTVFTQISGALDWAPPLNKRHIWDKKVNKRRPRIIATVLMWCLFEEFRKTEKPLWRKSKSALEMSFRQRGVLVEGESEISVEWRHHWKVPKEVNGDNEKTLLLLTVIFSYRWKIYRSIKWKDFFVASNF